MIRLPITFLFVLLALLIVTPGASTTRAENGGSWDFDVFIDDKKIGKHRFDVSTIDEIRQVKSTADFNYKILFVSLYRYEHRATERWLDDCLVTLEASTNANGEQVQVSGEQSDSGFVIERDANREQLPSCIMTFAYWNPEFLNQPRLLNPQTGQYIDVSVEVVGDEVVQVRGLDVQAKRYRLTAYETDLTLWYSTNEEWLALESVAKGGKKIRYELS